jgi:hypothetical protein
MEKEGERKDYNSMPDMKREDAGIIELYLSLSPFLSLGNKERNARERLVAACPK